MVDLVQTLGNACHSIAITVFAEDWFKVSIVTNIRIVTPNYFAQKPQCGHGRTDAQNWEHLMNSVKKLMSAHWHIIVGMLPTQIRKTKSKSVYLCILKIMAPDSDGSLTIIKNPNSTITNTMDNIVNLVWLFPTMTWQMSGLQDAPQLITSSLMEKKSLRLISVIQLIMKSNVSCTLT